MSRAIAQRLERWQQGQFAQGKRHRQQGVAGLHGRVQPRQGLAASQARLQERLVMLFV